MRVGNYTLLIPEGAERSTDHVELPHGAHYTVRLMSAEHTKRCDVELSVDGKPMGSYRLDPGGIVTLERPAHDAGRFTFYKGDSAEGEAVGAASVAREDRGLVVARFRPEYRPKSAEPVKVVKQYGARGQSMTLSSAAPAAERCSMFPPVEEATTKGLASGVTGLSGHSNQRFVTVPDLDYDPAAEVVIRLRLVVRDGAARPLAAAPALSNPIPPPVD